jgi:hypothetical protein
MAISSQALGKVPLPAKVGLFVPLFDPVPAGEPPADDVVGVVPPDPPDEVAVNASSSEQVDGTLGHVMSRSGAGPMILGRFNAGLPTQV